MRRTFPSKLSSMVFKIEHKKFMLCQSNISHQLFNRTQTDQPIGIFKTPSKAHDVTNEIQNLKFKMKRPKWFNVIIIIIIHQEDTQHTKLDIQNSD